MEVGIISRLNEKWRQPTQPHTEHQFRIILSGLTTCSRLVGMTMWSIKFVLQRIVGSRLKVVRKPQMRSPVILAGLDILVLLYPST